MDKAGEINTEHTVFIGVGSNIGDRYENIRNAEKGINCSTNCKVIEISKIYETEPFGYLDQNKFLNCVFKIKTTLSPEDLLKFLLETEKILKRERIIHWGPRTIDLDILFYDNLIISSKKLVIPHPGIALRMFVLKPLCDLAPQFIHPVKNEQCYLLAKRLEVDQPVPEEWLTK